MIFPQDHIHVGVICALSRYYYLPAVIDRQRSVLIRHTNTPFGADMAAVGPRSSSWLLAALAGAAALLVRRARRRYRSSSVWHVTTAFSRRLRAVPPNPFDDLIPLMQRPGASVLAQGVPPHSCSPLASASFTLTNGASIELDAAEMALAQRYAPFAWAGLKAWLREHVQQQHAPPLASWSVSLAAGSMSSVDLAIAMLVDPGDVVLLEEFSFTAGTHHTPPLTHHLFQTNRFHPTSCIQPLQPGIGALRASGARLVPLANDEDGLVPDALEAACVALAREGKLSHPKSPPCHVPILPTSHPDSDVSIPTSRRAPQAPLHRARRSEPDG